MKNNEVKTVAITGVIFGLAFPVFVVLMMLYYGMAGTIMYNWFIPEFFPAMPNLNILEGTALYTTTHYFCNTSNSEKRENIKYDYIALFIKPLIVLAVAAVLKVLM